MGRRSPSPKDIGLLYQLYREGQLDLEPEFQRNAIWPRPAKAYLIDTILSDKPMPLLFFHRSRSPQTGKTHYSIVDGQQRLRAIFEFAEGKIRLPKDSDRRWRNKKFQELSKALQDNFWNYDLNVEELNQFSDKDIRDIFARMNRYVVKLSPQELRNARQAGRFSDFVERVGALGFWRNKRVFTPHQIRRMRNVEFAAEAIILLVEGPQDKKSPVDLYYRQYQSRFPGESRVKKRLLDYLKWIEQALPDLSHSRYRKPTDLYGLLGALDAVSKEGKKLSSISPRSAGKLLMQFQVDLAAPRPGEDASAYLIAASRQTDNIAPRNKRIAILSNLLKISQR